MDSDHNSPLLDTGSEFDGKKAEIKDVTENVKHRKLFTVQLGLTVTTILLSPVCFGYVLGYTSPTKEALMRDLWNETSTDTGHTSTNFSLFLSLPTIGAIFGGMGGGPLSELIGRKKAVALVSLPLTFGFLLVSLAIYCEDLAFFGRFLQGVGIGLTSSTAPVYLSEIAPVHLRGAIGAGFQLSITFGFLLVYSLFKLDWKIISYGGALVAVVGGIATFLVAPESPVWLVKTGNKKEALLSLRRLRGDAHDSNLEIETIDTYLEQTDTSHMTRKEKLRHLLTPATLKPLAIGSTMMIFQQFSGVNAVLGCANDILRTAGLDNASVGTIYVGIVQFCFTLLSTFIVDKLGRKVLLTTSCFGMAVGAVGMALSYHYPQTHGMSSVNLLSMILYIATFSVGMGPIPWLITSEIYPSHVRGICVSISVIINWLMAFVVTFTFDLMKGALGNEGVFWLFGGVVCFAAMWTTIFVPETKGRSDEEIARLFVGRRKAEAGYTRI